jgi:hypothetical protein
MLGHGQGGVEVPRRNDAGAGRPKITFYVERNQGFVFDKEHELSRKQIQRHCMSLSAISWIRADDMG